MLTDNGTQFTGRFTKPRRAEVLFERVCREHGITAKLTRPHSPTTTGKVERWHQTLRRELLDVAGQFARRAPAGHITPGLALPMRVGWYSSATGTHVHKSDGRLSPRAARNNLANPLDRAYHT